MRSWLRNWTVSRATADLSVSNHIAPVASARPVMSPVAGGYLVESLEGRALLSASPFDLTNAYTGTIKYKVGKLRIKEAISVTLTSQASNGFVSGQVVSNKAGTINVSGFVNGRSLMLIGTNSGRKLEAKIGKKARSLSGQLLVGADDSVGKFKLKLTGDAPAPGAAAANTTVTTTIGNPRARALTATSTDGGALDPSIDPATGLPIDPVTGGVINPGDTGGVVDDYVPPPSLPSDFPGGTDSGTGSGTGTGTGGGTVINPGTAAPTVGSAAAPGQLIGTNYSFLGNWQGFFNFEEDPNGIFDPTDNSTDDPAVNGTRPGLDARDVTILISSQLDDGLVQGTMTIAELGDFNVAGFVNGDIADLIIVGTGQAAGGTGLVQLDLTDGTFDGFTGTLNADVNGFTADDTLIGTWIDDGGTTPPPPPPPPIPTGEELYHVDDIDPQGGTTIGNFDPDGATIGSDFSVGNREIIVNSLGAFDDGADGLNNTIRVALYNTTSPGTALAVFDLTTSNSALAPGSSFRYLTTFTPITLTTGIYRIVAYGYGGTELAGDIGVDNYTGPVPTANTGSTGNEIVYPISNGANGNSWTSNPNGTALAYPTNPSGLPLNRYLGGSLLFEEGNIIDPGGGTVPPTVPPPPPLTKPANSAYPGGVFIGPNGTTIFGSQSSGII
jgi:hypothetical protein